MITETEILTCMVDLFNSMKSSVTMLNRFERYPDRQHNEEKQEHNDEDSFLDFSLPLLISGSVSCFGRTGDGVELACSP